jgi:hypothetical protein
MSALRVVIDNRVVGRLGPGNSSVYASMPMEPQLQQHDVIAAHRQSQLCSRIADKIPGFQGIALVHDTIMGDSLSPFWNFGTMPPAAALTYASFIGEWGVPVTLMRPFYNQRGGAY